MLHHMRGLTRRWLFRGTPDNSSGSLPPQNALDLPPVVRRVLAARGMHDAETILRFCEPKLTHLYDPALMPNIDTAATRLVDAVRRDELIAIYGDYDVDGITATAILYHIIKTVQPKARITTYVPHRLDEGYGLNCDALRQLKSDGVDLVISVDCGVTASQSAKTARDIGLDLIITDHHNLPPNGAPLPDAVAVVHPRLPTADTPYPFGDLCGAGVAFKLAWRFATTWCNSERVSEQLQKALLHMLPLVALGTIADVAPLVDENRVLTAYGLRFIKHTPLPGLRALIEASGLMDEKIDSEKVGFVLGPRLNACGRMGHAADAVRMLTDAPADEAIAIAHRLTELNRQRQNIEQQILDQASRMAEDRGMTASDRRMIALAHESWHPGVVGIVCSRLVERFGRPAILLQRLEDICKGSARSIEGYSIHDGIAAGARYLTTFGGHSMAAGLSLVPTYLEPFVEVITEHANRHITADQLTPALTIDCDALLGELDLATVRRLHALSPFGRGNRAPTLRVRNIVVAEPPRQIGSQGKHLSLRLREDGPASRRWLRAVWWNAGERAADLAAGMRLDVVIEPKLNAWNGRVNVEAELRDVCICEA